MIETDQKRVALEWGPWLLHAGGGMPVPKGTIVEAGTFEPIKKAKYGVRRRVGIAGIDLIKSWGWTPETRETYPALPIDYYRIKRPKALTSLKSLISELPELEDA